jgi:hypothetical protein
MLDASDSIKEQRAKMQASTENLIRMSKAGAAPVYQGNLLACRVMSASVAKFVQQLS